jgi:pimeloyl-ACP methyl ester carboxylesterase
MRSAVWLCVVLLVVWPRSGVGQIAGSDYDSVQVNGLSLAYRVVGQGEPLVLLHGFYGTGGDWDPLLEGLSSSFQLIVPDLRGHGRSTNPHGVFTHRESAADIYALLDYLGIERFRGMGFSSGGMTLLHMATSQPDRPEALVLIGATSYFPDEARRFMVMNAPDSISDERAEAMARLHGGAERADALFRQFYGFKDSFVDMNFTTPLLATVRAPTLIVHGDRDPFFPVQIPVEQYLAIPESYLWIVPNSGHVPFPGQPESREHFVHTVRQFLSGSWD